MIELQQTQSQKVKRIICISADFIVNQQLLDKSEIKKFPEI